MSKFNSWAILSGWVSLIGLSVTVSAQEPVPVHNHAAAPVQQAAPAGNCDTCTSEAGFGYPQNCDNCQGNCVANCLNQCKAHWNHTWQEAAKVEARNDAWPRPFDCADRRLYFSYWDVMYQQGFQYQATLTSDHFNADNELNGYGKSTLAMIMNNMPIGQRNVFVLRTGDEQASEARLAHVKDVYNTWYASRGTQSQIVFADKAPIPGRGNRYETINRSYFENTPPPVIAVATGTGNTSNIQAGQ